MNAELGVLIELQAVDVEIARLNAEVSYLPKHLAEIEVKLQSHVKQLESDRQVLAAHLKQRKGFEDEIKIIREKISKYRDQMLAVKTNEQYRAFQKEIEYAEKEIGVFEDKILQTMVSDDDLNGAVKRAEAALAAEKKVVEKEKAEVTARTGEDQELLAERMKRRQELQASISADTYKRYEWIRERKKTAISEARDGYCTGCRVLLRPQLYNEVRAKDVILACEGCGRLLYYIPTPVAQPTPDELGAHHPS